jgi:3-hydroxyisobutyrate dehydrogenase-like beta-hydroxyacid dehydrogenase
MSLQNIAVIGAGRMGRPMVDRLVAAGYAPVIHARRPETQAAAEAAGLRWAGSVTETVRDADLVLTVVFDEAQLRAVTLGHDGALAAMKPGSILIQHTTCDPAVVTEIEHAATSYGVEVLDAAVSGTPRDIAAGQLTVWAGGPQATLDSARAALGSYASPVLPVGPVGHGQRVKLVNNALFVAQVGLAVEAVRVAAGVGLREADVLAALQHGSGASRALSAVAWIGAGNVGPRLSEFMIKDVDAVRAIAERAQVDLGLLGDVLDSPAVRDGVLNGGIAADRDLAARSRGVPGAIKSEPGQ